MFPAPSQFKSLATEATNDQTKTYCDPPQIQSENKLRSTLVRNKSTS